MDNVVTNFILHFKESVIYSKVNYFLVTHSFSPIQTLYTLDQLKVEWFAFYWLPNWLYYVVSNTSNLYS